MEVRGERSRLSCHDFVDNHARPQLFALAYNLGNSLLRPALPGSVAHGLFTPMREKPITSGARAVRPARYVVFQMAEVAAPRRLFRTILDRIHRHRAAEAAPW